MPNTCHICFEHKSQVFSSKIVIIFSKRFVCVVIVLAWNESHRDKPQMKLCFCLWLIATSSSLSILNFFFSLSLFIILCLFVCLFVSFFFQMGYSRPLFIYFRLFYKQLTVNNCSIKVADGWIRTRVLWYQKRPRCQLCHNHNHLSLFLCLFIFFIMVVAQKMLKIFRFIFVL